MIEIFEILVKDDYILAGQHDPEGRLFLHFTYKDTGFTKSKYKSLLEDWHKTLETFRAMGIDAVYSAIPLDWKKEQKWQTMFGLDLVAKDDRAYFYKLEL